ncbi:hypothetical protein BD779DRAFT_829028 [Infundibulicybe gibba]|nr:hypothetical protein BD779DRAFT_829028 [Infundibulicybe gibba]
MADVDMLDISTISSSLPTASSALAHQPSTDPIEPSSIAIPVLLNQPNVVQVTADSNGGTPRPTGSASASAKPKSAKAPKPRSPSPSPPPPPAPPLQTIRLTIRLGGPDNYEVDIAAIARANGLRPPTPIPTKRDTSDSEGEPEPEQDGVKLKRKRKNAGTEYYDVSDPFIDDSELAVDERKFFAQTKQQGFYVSSGEVALLKDKTPKKPKKKQPIDPGPSNQDGTKDAPISLSDGESAQQTENAGQKRKRYVTLVEGGKKRKVVDIVRLSVVRLDAD